MYNHDIKYLTHALYMCGVKQQTYEKLFFGVSFCINLLVNLLILLLFGRKKEEDL